MSLFLFGTIQLSPQHGEATLHQMAWDFCRCASASDIWTFLGHNIPQSIVFEMLGKQAEHEANVKLAYLLTNGPLADTSDGLLMPEETYQLADKVPIAPLVREKLDKIQTFLVRASAHVDSMSLYLTDGFSPSFDTEILESRAAFAESAFQDWMAHGEFSSRRYVVRVP